MPKRPIRIEGDVAYVPLTKGYEAVIDAADVPLVEGRWWRAHVVRRKGDRIAHVYAARHDNSTGTPRTVYLHRGIANTPDGMSTDHIDGNGLNNRRANLRSVTPQQNSHNKRIQVSSTSGVKGVSWRKLKRKWQARITLNGKSFFLGLFDTLAEAAEAYAKASTELHGEFGRTSPFPARAGKWRNGMVGIRDEDGRPLKSGDYITFTFGIPPTSVLCRITSTGGPLVAECLDPPNVKPRTEKLASLMKWYQVWKAPAARVTEYSRRPTAPASDASKGAME